MSDSDRVENDHSDLREESESWSRALLDKIINTTSDCLFWKDKHRRFMGVNRAFLEFYGFESEDVLLGKTDEEMGWHPDPGPFQADEERVLQGESTHLVHGLCRIRGEVRDILASKSPIYVNGEIVGLVGSFIDVTESYRQQREITRLASELQDSLENERRVNREMNNFLSRVSHEIRTPMNAIIGLSALGMTQTDRDVAISYLRKINSSAQYLLGIINDVLDINKIKGGELRLVPEEASIEEMIDSVHGIIDPLAQSGGIDLTIDASAVHSDHVICDRMRVLQILINLLNNAVKFTDPGGYVRCTISQENTPDGRFQMTFVVEDNGCGMSPSFLPRLFKPFSQENRNPSRYGTGTGLGLAISQTYATMMGGEITCVSQEQKGTTFTVRVLFDRGTQSDPDTPSAGTAAGTDALRGRRVLLAEDNQINQEVAVGTLMRFGVITDTVDNGERAVRVFSAAPVFTYDAILMDIQMPVMDGYQAARMIRALQRPDAQSVPIIAMSADLFGSSLELAMQHGMNAYVTKPFDMDQLYGTLKREILRTGPAREDGSA